MKKIFLFIVLFLLLLVGLVYWSLSVGPSKVEISTVTPPIKAAEIEFRQLDKVQVKATNQYESSSLKRFMQGVNYREVWEVPVTARVFFLDTFEIIKEGGGNQTRSLKIKDPPGIIYSLRSINKDPAPLIPKVAKILNLENIINDGISAQHPYGAILAASLADATGLLHTHPQIVYVPVHDELKNYNERYGNRLYLLEYETESEINWTSYENVIKIVETDDLQELKAEMGKKLKVDTRMLVRARLFDLLIGDWDRHSKQWGWVLQQQENHVLAIPLPGDRDNAFFRIDGVIPTIITNKLVQPMVRPFENDIDHIEGYIYPFDLYFLKDIPESIFIQEAKNLQASLDNENIKNALEAWPQEVSELNGEEIEEKLIKRRDRLVEYAKTFHKLIQKKDYLEEPLKGSEELNLSPHLVRCFECLPQ